MIAGLMVVSTPTPAAAPRTASAELVQHWIGGRAAGGAGARQDVFNPATGSVARQVLLASAADVASAVASARGAFTAWANTPPVRRARVLTRFLARLNEERDTLAAPSTSEQGKGVMGTRGGVGCGIGGPAAFRNF
jgi:malonate-semialdehyde dehydrogenase (acetylating)/methylmalonate-semialdehyde dehydrogenase